MLATRSYFVGSSQTLADIVLYYILHGIMVSNLICLDIFMVTKFSEVFSGKQLSHTSTLRRTK